ncbi:hypothetical protein [Plantactinospora sp. KLBMP9567]|uniref:golvesin C-terminal-like domain-containing protein n=1 Tax=Plantactinospora sp. KLBMP9567 TaxID=3085900 RepID=UPI002980CEC3|nr:hypothetical protein [Plantactinospora sp. KLBMP9567]MDW5328524.1 hypothetical protein [Plantactinospora sp. KLBMP9567]
MTTIRRSTAYGAAVVLLASLSLGPPTVATAKPDSEPAGAASAVNTRAAVADPDAVLGDGWRQSSDMLVTGVGDTDGFHLYVAREKDAFAWSTLVTLNAGLTEAGAWTGNVCVTGSGRYAAVVYAPATFTNKPKLMTAGAFAAVVDLKTGDVTQLAERVQLAYFNPSCGPTDRMLLTRAVGVENRQTDLLGVDPVAAKVTSTRRIPTHVANPVPAPDGDYAIVRGALNRIDETGRLTRIAEPGGAPFAAQATRSGAIDVLTVQTAGDGSERAVALRYVEGRETRLGEGPRSRLQLFGLTGGRNVLVGDVSGVSKSAHPDLSIVATARKVRAVSEQGHLLALEMSTKRDQVTPDLVTGQAGAVRGANTVQVTTQATATGRISVGTVVSQNKPAGPNARTAPVKPGTGSQPGAAPERGRDGGSGTMDHHWPIGQPSCAIPRNDISRQVLQPSANQVEWAVDLAVKGALNVQRPADYLKTNMPAYRPQTMFGLPSGPKVPAQIMLAILAQETNLYQASWHAVAGDAGNPLVSDFYGQRAFGGSIEYIDFSESDCGYGISQVTDGMRRGQTKWSLQEQVAIATDYAANIAAGLQILVEKYNQLRGTNTWVNNDDPQYLENWYLAVWGYNSGVYTAGNGRVGVGFFNNPANPDYPANREPFLRASLDDASHPSDWTYPEKIMGWAETPQWQWIDPRTKYAKPLFGSDSGLRLGLPSRYQFCSASNACNPNQPSDPCPAWNETCRFNGHTSWLESNANAEFAREWLEYHAGDPEPAVIIQYPRRCTPFASSPTLIVDDLGDSSRNLLGCAGQQWGGKFTLRPGFRSGTVNTEYGQVDLHQLGAGYLGHAWFSHAYDGEDAQGQPTDWARTHQVVGTWTPYLLTTGTYDVVAHLPSHGANIPNATYVIKPVPGEPENIQTCVIDQDAVTRGVDRWVHLGQYTFAPGGRVQLSNMIENTYGTVDVAWDAMAFIPASAGHGRPCMTVW